MAKILLDNGTELEISETFVAEHFEEIPEQWKPVVGYEGLYEVSNYGKVRSIKRDIILKPYCYNGYLYVSLYKNGEVKCCRVHRIVAQAFIPNPENKATVNHKNEVRDDNRVCNLEWNTYKENIRYSLAKRVMCIETGDIYDSIMEAAEKTGIHYTGISQCCNGKIKTAGGFHWCFV